MRSISIDYSQIRQQKVRFFHIFLSLIISSRRHRLQITNEADEVLLGKRPRQQATGIKTPRKMYGKKFNLRTPCQHQHYGSVGKLGQRSKGNMRRLETIKDNKLIHGEKHTHTHLLLRILAVIGRYGPYLMVVTIFEFPTVSLDFTLKASV